MYSAPLHVLSIDHCRNSKLVEVFISSIPGKPNIKLAQDYNHWYMH